MPAERVTKAMRDSVREVVSRAGSYTDPELLLTDICSAVLAGFDEKVRWVVLTQDPTKNVLVFGPYANPETARAAMESGHMAAVEGTIGDVFPLIPMPTNRKKRTATHAARKTEQSEEDSAT